MRTLDHHLVRFGELAGHLLSGHVFFDWTAIAIQGLAIEIDYSFEEILAARGMPYAPVRVQSQVARYPRAGDVIAVDVTPTHVGEHRMDVHYEFIIEDAGVIATSLVTHVTVGPNGRAKPLPERAKSNLQDHVGSVNEFHLSSPAERFSDADPIDRCVGEFSIRTPHIEGAGLAYFDQYPAFATIVMEEFLEMKGMPLGSTDAELYPLRPQAWGWQFRSPVNFETTLRVENDILDVGPSSLLVEHEFMDVDGQENGVSCIDGWTEYGCFDRNGQSIQYPERILDAVEQ